MADVTDPAAVQDLIDGTVARQGRLDCVVANAGVMRSGSVADLDPADWELTLRTNLTAPYLLARAALPHLTANRGSNAGAPLFGLAGPASGGYGSVAIRRLVELVVLFDMLAVLIGCAVAGSRGFFAMGRDHRLPRVLGRVSNRGTPLTASIFVLALYLVVVAATQWWTGLFAQTGLPHYVAMFSWFSTLGSFALACIYLLMSVGAVRGLADHPKRWAVLLAAAVGVLVTAAAIYGSVYQVKPPTIWAPWAAVGILALGFLFTVIFPGRAPATSAFDDLAAAECGPQKA